MNLVYTIEVERIGAFDRNRDAVPIKRDPLWCDGDGRNMQINGPRIVTPTGAEILGRYSRHAFTYEVAQADAGATVSMVLVNESTIHLRRSGGASPTPPEAFEV